MLITILANITVATIILTLLAFAISVMIKQGKEESCASCSTKKRSACKGCQFADKCH
ncbi:MAG: FeoB-associated Cys-rich membrane protein [Sphaerochaeta sp.]|jgi:hypothetical protein|nr:FeoB-associated Cys-rich membrane protein [Sphaerochaeta sp.]